MKKLILLFSVLFLFSFRTQETKMLKFEFTLEEIQTIYDALGELPAKKVEALRNKIVTEANRQMSDTTSKKK